MTRRIVIIGAGGHGREVHDVVDAINLADGDSPWDFVGFLDDGLPDAALLSRRGGRLLGGRAELRHLAGCCFVIGIGSPQARRELDIAARSHGLIPATLIHPTASFGLDVNFGDGTVVCSHVSVTTNVTLGRHVHLNLNSTVSHDTVLGDFVTVNPGATVSGNVRLADDVTIGANSTVIQGLSIGAGTTVGAGAAVVRDLPPGVTAVGVPARPLSRL